VATELEKDRWGKPVSKQINDYESEKYVLKSRYTMVKYQMNLSQIDQIKGLKSFEEYTEALQVDYFGLIETHLDNISYERDDQKDNAIGHLFKQKKMGGHPIGGASLTSRPDFGGTSKIENSGGYSSRENSGFRNLAEFNGGPQQMHTQEDQTTGSNDQIYILGQQKNSTALLGNNQR
jgi:hypothetical protein